MIYYLLSILPVAFIVAGSAVFLDLLFSHLGVFYLASGALFGIGAYVYALAFEGGSIVGLFLAGIASAFFALLTTLPFINRTQQSSFIFVSLAIQLVVFYIFNNLFEFTRGAVGIQGITLPMFLQNLSEEAWKLVYASAYLLMAILCSTMWGKTLLSKKTSFVRQDELLAVELGIRPIYVKLIVFSIVGMGIGLGGALYGGVNGFISPADASLEMTLLFTVMVMVAPRTKPHLIGLIGVALYSLPELARFLGESSTVPAIRNVLFGSVLVFLGVRSSIIEKPN